MRTKKLAGKRKRLQDEAEAEVKDDQAKDEDYVADEDEAEDEEDYIEDDDQEEDEAKDDDDDESEQVSNPLSKRFFFYSEICFRYSLISRICEHTTHRICAHWFTSLPGRFTSLSLSFTIP